VLLCESERANERMQHTQRGSREKEGSLFFLSTYREAGGRAIAGFEYAPSSALGLRSRAWRSLPSSLCVCVCACGLLDPGSFALTCSLSLVLAASIVTAEAGGPTRESQSEILS